MAGLRIALAQINATVGDLRGNALKIAGFTARARRAGADLVLFPELALTGYPPEDLLLKPSFVQDNLAALKGLAPSSRGLAVVVGFVDRDEMGELYNAAAVLEAGRLVDRYHKILLPNYGVFDEKRYFAPGLRPMVRDVATAGKPVRVGVSICEDIWKEEGPCSAEAAMGARVLVNISSSPYHAGKRRLREELLARRARGCGCWVVYVNLVGGQDELVFDGGSMVVDPRGRAAFRAPQFEEGLYRVDIPIPKPVPGTVYPVPFSGFRAPKPAALLGPEEEIFGALTLGLKDYVRKNGFSTVVVGLSGGVDSNLTAAVAVAALGKRSVVGVSMPSRYSSSGTRRDARAAAKVLGIRFVEVPIEPVLKGYLEALEGAIGKTKAGVAEENLQARIRGTLLMALSNKFGWLVLATGNKSEISTGYCTLYGDMVGGFAVIKDVPKTGVYRVARYANRSFRRKVIPESVLRRAPSAELRFNQTDQDTLPPYDLLDGIIRAYVEERRPAAEIRRKTGASAREVARVLRRIDVNEYKRRQAPVGIKITPLAFGKDRRMPITNAYRES